MPCSGDIVMDTPVLAALCERTLNNYVTNLDVYQNTFLAQCKTATDGYIESRMSEQGRSNDDDDKKPE